MCHIYQMMLLFMLFFALDFRSFFRISFRKFVWIGCLTLISYLVQCLLNIYK